MDWWSWQACPLRVASPRFALPPYRRRSTIFIVGRDTNGNAPPR